MNEKIKMSPSVTSKIAPIPDTLLDAACSQDIIVRKDQFKDDRAFSLLHQELPQILVLCFP